MGHLDRMSLETAQELARGDIPQLKLEQMLGFGR